ncbi:MAG: TonB-dependent receptor [Candidatus Binatia bacterium]|nr:TonB-dependent receptor [Candidatus Binatia bacterium]
MNRFHSALRAFAFTLVLVLGGRAGAQPAAVEGSLPATPPPVEETALGEIDSGAREEGRALQAISKIEEITVTARRREEFLEDTPIAVTALSMASLQNSNVTRIDQIQQLVPNLTIQSGGSAQVAQIVIRGVGSSGVGVSFDPGVGLYIDGVYLPRAQGSIFDVVDIQSVEVLRGPQGTLFGKNTVGGAVSVTTVKPGDELKALFSVRPGNMGQIRTRMSLDVPVIDGMLFSRFTFASRNRDGYVYNKNFDEFWGEENGLSFIGALRFVPTSDLTIDVSGSWFKDQTHSASGECVFIQPGGLGSEDYYNRCRQTSPRVISTNVDQIAATSSWGAWGTIAYDVGDLGPLQEITAKSITSWRQQKSPTAGDVDGTALPVIQIANIGGADPIDGRAGTAQQVQQELQLAASAWEEKISFVTGAFLFWEKSDRRNGVQVPLVNQNNVTRVISDNWNWALFAQGTVSPLDWLSVTGGIRYTEDKKGSQQINRNVNLPEEDQVFVNVTGDKIFTAWTPMASLALFAPEEWLAPAQLDHLMGYFTYSRGFKGGGLNAVLGGDADLGLLPFEPETLDNFEIGAKIIGFDQRVTLNLAVFESKYDGIQRTQLESEIGDEGELEVRALTLNAAKARIRGVEAELRAIPIDGLMITANFGFLDAKYDSFPNSTNSLGGSEPLDRSGERLPNSPEYNSFVAAQYSIPVEVEGWLSGFLTPRVEWAYRDRDMFVGPELEQATQPGYSLLNARLSYDFLDDRAQVALWGRNLTDETYFNSAFNLAGSIGTLQRTYAAPRLWGAELTYQF